MSCFMIYEGGELRVGKTNLLEGKGLNFQLPSAWVSNFSFSWKLGGVPESLKEKEMRRIYLILGAKRTKEREQLKTAVK